jgi:transposase
VGGHHQGPATAPAPGSSGGQPSTGPLTDEVAFELGQGGAIEFKQFLVRIDRAVPAELDVHVICDISSTHITPEIRRWLLRHPRFHLHFTPTYSSWLNLVERWFAERTTKWLKRGTHRSVGQLTAPIQSWIDSWNQDPRPFVWTKTADQILENITGYLQRISNSVPGSG